MSRHSEARKQRVLASIERHGFIFDRVWIEKLLDIGYILYNHNGYPTIRMKIDGVEKRIRIPRLMMNCPENLTVDHINRNTKDNRVKNLRVVTLQENLKNRSKTYKSHLVCLLCGQKRNRR